MRTFFIALMIAAQLGLGVVDMAHHHWRIGVAAMLLAVVNLLLFVR